MTETERTEEPRDLQVDQLRALFPQVEIEILEAVLAASGGSLDEATEQLLVMNDPEYKPDPVEVRSVSLSRRKPPLLTLLGRTALST